MYSSIEILNEIKEDIRQKFEADPLIMRAVSMVITEFETRTKELHDYRKIRDWTDARQRMKIAREFGITSSSQICNVINGKTPNFTLLNKLIEAAENNKKLIERARKL